MDTEEFERRLKELKEAEIPSCPLGIEAAVLLRVRADKRMTEASVWEWLNHWIVRPRFATAALSVGAFMTIASSALAVRLNQPDESSLARTALGFDSLYSYSVLDLDRP